MVFLSYINYIFIASQIEPHEYFKIQFNPFAPHIPSNDTSVQKMIQTAALLFKNLFIKL